MYEYVYRKWNQTNITLVVSVSLDNNIVVLKKTDMHVCCLTSIFLYLLII